MSVISWVKHICPFKGRAMTLLKGSEHNGEHHREHHRVVLVQELVQVVHSVKASAW